MGYGADDESIMRAPWPQPFAATEIAAWGVSPEVTAYVDARRELVTAGRALRADYNIAPARFVKYVIRAVDAEAAGRLSADLNTLKQQLRAEEIEIRSADADGGASAMPGTLCKLGAVCLPLEGLVDVKAEAARVKAELDKTRGFLKGIESKLANPGFVSKAPAAVVEQQREKQRELTNAIERLQTLYDTFCGQA